MEDTNGLVSAVYTGESSDRDEVKYRFKFSQPIKLRILGEEIIIEEYCLNRQEIKNIVLSDINYNDRKHVLVSVRGLAKIVSDNKIVDLIEKERKSILIDED